MSWLRDEYEARLARMRAAPEPRRISLDALERGRRFHMLRRRGWTLQRIGDSEGISKERVRQILRRTPEPDTPVDFYFRERFSEVAARRDGHDNERRGSR